VTASLCSLSVCPRSPRGACQWLPVDLQQSVRLPALPWEVPVNGCLWICSSLSVCLQSPGGACQWLPVDLRQHRFALLLSVGWVLS
jgi:hypothetical protein